MLQINSMLNIASDQSNAKSLFFSCLIFAEYQLDCMWGNKSSYNLELSLFIRRGDNTVSPLPLPTISWAKGDSSHCINTYFYKHVSAWATEICLTYLCLGKMNDYENYCWMLLSTRWESMQPGNGGFKYSRFLTDPKVYILKDACHRVSMCNYMNTFFFNRWMRMQKESLISNLVPMGQMGT